MIKKNIGGSHFIQIFILNHVIWEGIQPLVAVLGRRKHHSAVEVAAETKLIFVDLFKAIAFKQRWRFDHPNDVFHDTGCIQNDIKPGTPNNHVLVDVR